MEPAQSFLETGLTKNTMTNTDKIVGNLQISEDLNVGGSQTSSVTEVDSATYTILTTDRVIAVDYTATGTATLTLPSATSSWDTANGTGLAFLIKDSGASASANNITINRAGSDTIVDSQSGQTSTVIATDGSAIWIQAKDATTWIVY